MPYIYTNAPTKNVGEYIAIELIDEIAEIVGSPVDWFCFMNSTSPIISAKQVVDNRVIIKCKWYARTQEIKDALAKFLKLKIEEKFNFRTTVIFSTIPKGDFF